jgi:hypothetical protein
MLAVIASFGEPGQADAYSRALHDDFGIPADGWPAARIGAYGEPYDGDRLVVAWVTDARADDIRSCAERHGATLHVPAAGGMPPGGPASAGFVARGNAAGSDGVAIEQSARSQASPR